MTENQPDNDLQLLTEVASGNERAFEQLFDKYWQRIYNVALTYLKHPGQAEDTTQDIFLLLWLRRTTLASIDNFGNYLYIMARNNVFRKLQKKSRIYPVGPWVENLQETILLPDQLLDARKLRELIREAETQLPPKQLEAWRLNREQGMSYEQVARTMNIAKNTAKNHIVKSLNFIRDYISNTTGETLPAILIFSFFHFQ